MILESLRRDIRLACRGLWRAKVFSAAAVVTLALGIAGTTVMFTLVQSVLLRRLPVRDQERIIVAWKDLRSSGYTHYPFGDDGIDGVREALLEDAAGVDANGAGREVISEAGVSNYVQSALVTGGFFDVLGVQAALGRAFTRADDVEGAEGVVVISHGLWQRRYGGSPGAIGRRVVLGERPFTIVGVMPRGLDYPGGVELWRTTHSVPAGGPFGDAARHEIDLVARLRTGATIDQAANELTGLTKRLESTASPDAPHGLIPVVHSFEDAVVGTVRSSMMALMAAVGLVLLVACANAANLLLMRGEARHSEFAVREALGASRGRIARELLAESVVLTVVAGAIGLVSAWWSLRGILTLLPEGLPRVESVRIDGVVVVFTIVVALVTSLLAAVAPAMSLARADLVSQLRTSARGVSGQGARRVRRALVIAQVAFAVTIVSGAGLVARSVLHLQDVDMGLASDRLVFVDLALPQGRYADRDRHAQFLDRAILQLEGIPAIAAATPVNVAPFSGDGGWDVPSFTAEGQSAGRAAVNPALNLESIHPNYFATFGIRIARGRAFTSADRQGALDVAIVSEDVASRTWPGQDPIGKRIKFGGPDSHESWRTVVGVAAPTRYRELARPRPTLYLPAAQFLMTAEMLVLRTAARLDVVASLARDRVRAVDPDVRVMRVAPFARMLDRPLARPRFNAFLLGIFGAAALLLAAVGLYAVMAAYVRQRDREIAIRVALGATAGNVRRLVLGEALGLSGLGAAVGLAGAASATRTVRAMLFEIDPLDPSTLMGAALLLIAVAALASYVPVRRAARIDPAAALRT